MFGNDPDVIILRNLKNKLKPDERYTLCVLNNILGALVFSSDNVSLYSQDEHLLYSATFPKVVSRVKSVLEFRHNCFIIEFTVNVVNGEPRTYTTYTNLCADEQSITLPRPSSQNHLLFATDNDMHMTEADKEEALFYRPSSSAKLKPHETKTFLHIPEPQPDQLNLLGTISHIVPGAELETFRLKAPGEVEVVFHKDNSRHQKVYLGIGNYLHQNRSCPPPSCKVNGVQVNHEWIPVSSSGEGPKSEVLALVIENN